MTLILTLTYSPSHTSTNDFCFARNRDANSEKASRI